MDLRTYVTGSSALSPHNPNINQGSSTPSPPKDSSTPSQYVSCLYWPAGTTYIILYSLQRDIIIVPSFNCNTLPYLKDKLKEMMQQAIKHERLEIVNFLLVEKEARVDYKMFREAVFEEKE